MLGALAVAVDQTAANRERGVQRDLLRGDRRDEGFERIGRERRAEAREPPYSFGEHGLALRERKKWRQVELEPEQLAYDGLDHVVERLDLDAAGRVRDANLPAGDDAVQRAVLPDVGAIDPPEGEA